MMNTMAQTDVILSSLNRLNEAKQTGGLQDTEFANIIGSIGKLAANKIEHDNVNEDEIDSLKAHLTGFTGENSDKYFSFPHKDLDKASKVFIERINRAQLIRNSQLIGQISNEDSYTKSMVR